MLKKITQAPWRLGQKFTVILIIAFVVGMIISGLILWQVLQTQVQRQIRGQAAILLDTMNATRQYTSEHIQPLLQEALVESTAFIPESVPAFSAREVFEDFRTRTGQQSYFYKEATLNPTNPRDLADDFETSLVLQMRVGQALTELSGYRQLDGQRVFYIARPLSINSPSCLSCHSTPQRAPSSLLYTYGDQGGFGWELGEVVSAQMIYVPAQKVFRVTMRSFWLMMLILIPIMAATIVLLNMLLQGHVIQPIGIMGKLSAQLSEEKMEAQSLNTDSWTTIRNRGDELGQLAKVFHKMALEVLSRTQNLRQQVQKLRIEIDEIKKEEEVNEIITTDYFKDIQKRAQELRERREKQRES